MGGFVLQLQGVTYSAIDSVPLHKAGCHRAKTSGGKLLYEPQFKALLYIHFNYLCQIMHAMSD